MGNPSKILGHIWDKREDTLQVPINKIEEGKPVTKNTILSQLARVYDPLGIIVPLWQRERELLGMLVMNGRVGTLKFLSL